MTSTQIKDCRWPWNRLYIHVTGEIKPCCYATSAISGVGDDRSLNEIWRGSEMQEIRQYVSQNRLHRVCAGAGCSFVQSKLPEGADFEAQVKYAAPRNFVGNEQIVTLARLGHPTSMFMIAHEIQKKIGPKPQYYAFKRWFYWLSAKKEQVQWMMRASSAGSNEATYTMGLFLYGLPNTIFNGISIKYLQKSGDQGDARANLMLAQIKMYSSRFRKADLVAAFASAEKAAISGMAKGYYIMGEIAKHDVTRAEESQRYFDLAKRRGFSGDMSTAV